MFSLQIFMRVGL